MLKLLLLVIIFLTCTAVGRALSGARRRRMEMLGELLAAIRVLRLRMLNSLEPLGILMRKADSALFRSLGNCLWEGEGLSECWEKYRNGEKQRGKSLDCITAADMGVLDHFFQNLGKSGREEQCTLFSETIAELEEAQAQARQLYRDASKVYTALGALVGIGICVIII